MHAPFQRGFPIVPDHWEHGTSVYFPTSAPRSFHGDLHQTKKNARNKTLLTNREESRGSPRLLAQVKMSDRPMLVERVIMRLSTPLIVAPRRAQVRYSDNNSLPVGRERGRIGIQFPRDCEAAPARVARTLTSWSAVRELVYGCREAIGSSVPAGRTTASRIHGEGCFTLRKLDITVCGKGYTTVYRSTGGTGRGGAAGNGCAAGCAAGGGTGCGTGEVTACHTCRRLRWTMMTFRCQ
jgi:hypothetical protein